MTRSMRAARPIVLERLEASAGRSRRLEPFCGRLDLSLQERNRQRPSLRDFSAPLSPTKQRFVGLAGCQLVVGGSSYRLRDGTSTLQLAITLVAARRTQSAQIQARRGDQLRSRRRPGLPSGAHLRRRGYFRLGVGHASQARLSDSLPGRCAGPLDASVRFATPMGGTESVACASAKCSTENSAPRLGSLEHRPRQLVGNALRRSLAVLRPSTRGMSRSRTIAAGGCAPAAFRACDPP
jgi:hypothetical protein